VIDDPRPALVERVAASANLQRAPRLRELFRYLCEEALRNPDGRLSEQQVGVAVFERPAQYDTNADTIVRVQVSQLRRKLEHHFLAEGRAEPLVIELPKGSYLPVFRPRVEPSAAASAAAAAEPMAIAPAPEPRATVRWPVLSFGLLLLVVAAGVLMTRQSLRPASSPGASPFRDHFWRQFVAGRETQVLLSDASVTMLAELRGRDVTLAEYSQGSYPGSVIADLDLPPKVRAVMEQAAVKGFTNVPDTFVADNVAQMCRLHHPAVHIVSARDLKPDLARSENLVVLGHRRANPWGSLFETSLDFTYRFDPATRTASIVNRAPQAGEKPAYVVDWGRRGYCVVAYLPKPRGEGNVLLVFGTDWVSVRAGGQFVTDEPALRGVHERLGAGLSEPIPFFAVLLQAELAGNVTTDYRPIAHRRVGPPAGER